MTPRSDIFLAGFFLSLATSRGESMDPGTGAILPSTQKQWYLVSDDYGKTTGSNNLIFGCFFRIRFYLVWSLISSSKNSLMYYAVPMRSGSRFSDAHNNLLAAHLIWHWLW